MEYKTQEEYLLALAEAIKYLNPKDATKVLQYYQTRITSSIEYGENEADVIRKLPSVDQVAKETYESHGVNYLELRKIQLRRKKIFTNIINTKLDTALKNIELNGAINQLKEIKEQEPIKGGKNGKTTK